MNLALVVATTMALGGGQLPNRLPKTESADFAIAAARAQLQPSYRKRPLGLDFNAVSPNPHLYLWTVIPTWGQGVVYFYVDRRTGTVWGGYNDCGPVRSPKLAALQARFRRRFHVSPAMVRKIEQAGDPRAECQP